MLPQNRRKLMVEDVFLRGLKSSRQIKISVIGRRTGRTITLPVWFVSEASALWLLPVHGRETQWYQNVLANPTITIQVGKERRTLPAKALKSPRAVERVVQSFRIKFTPEIIARLYPGPLNAAVKVKLQDTKP